MKRAEEEVRLRQRIKAGKATPEEIERFEQRPIVYHLYGGSVQVTAAPERTVEQWKAMLARRKGHTGPLIARDESTGGAS